jgi:hypothetical protein
LIALAAGAGAAARSSAAEYRAPAYRLDVDLLPDAHQLRVSGDMILPPKAAAYSRVRLKLSKLMHDFTVREVGPFSTHSPARVDGEPPTGSSVVYDITLPRLIEAGQSAHLSFSYAGGEKRGFVFSLEGPTYYAAGANTAWYPQIEGEERGTGQMNFTAPPGLTVIASGRRVPGTSSFVAPAPMHLSFAAANYHVTRLAGPIPVTGYTLKARPDTESYLAKVQQVVTGLAREFGRYPYPEISLAEVPRHQANSTGFDGASVEGLVLLSDYSLDDRFSVAFFGHELSHQWWGNSITARGVRGNSMLDEGMAQFGALQMVGLLNGSAAAERFRRTGDPSLASIQSGRGYFEIAAAGLDHPLANMPATTFVSHELANSKGAIVLDMLARTVGRDRFALALHDLTGGHAFQDIAWEDFLAAVQRRAGRDMRWFYRQWFDRTGAPDIALKWSNDSSGVTLELEQTTPAYEVRVPVRLTLASGASRTILVEMDRRLERAHLPHVRATSAVLDPHYDILRWTADFHSDATALAPITRANFLATDGRSKEAAAAYEAILGDVPASNDPWGLRFRAHRGLARIATGDDNWAEAKAELEAALAAPHAPPTELPWVYQSLASAAKALKDSMLMRWAIDHAVAADNQLQFPTGAGRAARALLD